MTNNTEFFSVFNAEQTKQIVDILNEYSKELLKGEYSTTNDAKACKAISLVNEIEGQLWQWVKEQSNGGN